MPKAADTARENFDAGFSLRHREYLPLVTVPQGIANLPASNFMQRNRWSIMSPFHGFGQVAASSDARLDFAFSRITINVNSALCFAVLSQAEESSIRKARRQQCSAYCRMICRYASSWRFSKEPHRAVDIFMSPWHAPCRFHGACRLPSIILLRQALQDAPALWRHGSMK